MTLTATRLYNDYQISCGDMCLEGWIRGGCGYDSHSVANCGAVVQACDCEAIGCGFDPTRGNEIFNIFIFVFFKAKTRC